VQIARLVHSSFIFITEAVGGPQSATEISSSHYDGRDNGTPRLVNCEEHLRRGNPYDRAHVSGVCRVAIAPRNDRVAGAPPVIMRTAGACARALTLVSA
jgi:hypothetical protein